MLIHCTLLDKIARRGSRKLQTLSPDQRADVLIRLADLLQSRKQDILRANSQDMAASEAAGMLQLISFFCLVLLLCWSIIHIVLRYQLPQILNTILTQRYFVFLSYQACPHPSSPGSS